MIKRGFDIAVSVTGCAALAIPAVLIAVLVKANSPGPALYWSDRVGRGGRMFRMPKFRTMKVGTPQVATDKLVDPSSRLTPIGGTLRRLSLDEIPQLWSVLKGDMSLVGPRPALFNQRELIEARRSRGIDALRPGITGWAQINGRDEIPERRKVELDAEYLEKRSFGMDCQILLLTFLRVARSDGVSH
jgi:O-antigen biosynthesis protein WbqP